MKRKLYEKNNLYKSQRIIDLNTATQYDPIDYFKQYYWNNWFYLIQLCM